MNTLGKKIGDLTKKDMESLAKPLGVRGRPYPMRDMVFLEDIRGERTLTARLGRLEDDDNPLIVYSDRPYAEVLGMAMREMPTPGMLPLFFDALARRAPQNRRRMQFLKGAAGAGKTYMSELIGRMRAPEGALKIDCSNMNLGELLFETVLDFNNSKTFYNELDKRLASGRLNPLSRRLLRDNLGDAWSEEGGRVAIDWHGIGHNLTGEDGAQVPSKDAVERALAALRRVSQLEGLDALGGNALGMATQEGALVRAFREGREIILDEFNRGKKGTTGVLHGVLQFLIGEIDECTVNNTLKEKGDDTGQSFTFRRGDMKAGFFVTLTGNTETDGSDVEELPQSLNSRIVPQHVPVATAEDWQHRICQMLTGMPVSTIYRSDEDRWKKNPEALRARLADWRKLREPRDVPDLQRRLLRRWEDVNEASEKLAKFYFGWSQAVNPDSALHRAGNMGQLLDEIDDTYHKEITIDFRKIGAHIAEALERRPSVVAPEDGEGYDPAASLEDTPAIPGLADANDAEAEAETAASFGARLSSVIVRHIVSTTLERGKTGLYKQLMQLAADCGVVEPQFHEARRSPRRSIASLLNDNPYNSPVREVRAELVRDLLCGRLRDAHGDAISASNGDIMPAGAVSRALDRLEAESPAGPVVFNTDSAGVHETPFAAIRSVDAAAESADSACMAPSAEPPAAAALVAQRDLLATFAAPGLRRHNLTALWNAAAAAPAAEGPAQPADESRAMARNDAKTDYAVTTIVVRADGTGEGGGAARPVLLHLVWNKPDDRLLIVGEGALGKDLRTAFNNSGTSYVDRLDEGAARKIEPALTAVLGTKDKKLRDAVKGAFLARNMLGSGQDESGNQAGALLVRRDVQCYLPHYLVGRGPAAKAE